jgi:hypothetical protein
MSTWILLGLLALSLAAMGFLWLHQRRLARAQFIRTYLFPSELAEKLRQKYPALDAKQFQLVARALRQFFLAYLSSGCQRVTIPSRVVDDLWHEFILNTRAYSSFCQHAFGHFFHHVPVLVGYRDEELLRTWVHACREENINPEKPTRLPLLFAIDAKLGIDGGMTHSAPLLAEGLRRRTPQNGDGESCAGGSGGGMGRGSRADRDGDGDGDGGGCGGD